MAEVAVAATARSLSSCPRCGVGRASGAVVDHEAELAAWSWRRHPDLTVVVDRAAGWTDGLWATRVRAGDVLEVAIGEERADGIPTPVIVTLEPGQALGVVGPADAAAAVASAIVVRLAVDVGPADLTHRRRSER